MEELDLKEILSMFWSNRKFICCIVAIATVLGLIFTIFILKPKYKANTKMILTQASSTNGTMTTQDATVNSKLTDSYPEVFTSDSVVNKVINNLELKGITGLEKGTVQKNIKVETASDNSYVLVLTVTYADPEIATEIANEAANVGIKRINELYEGINNIKVLDIAEINNSPTNINHIRDVIIAIVIGLAVAFGLLLVKYILDNTVKSADEIEKTCDVIVLASIPLYGSKMKKGGKK